MSGQRRECLREPQPSTKALTVEGLLWLEFGETVMEPRSKYWEIAPEPLKAMYGIGTYLARSGLESSLLELIKIRVSQINGCAFCLDMHTKDARAEGETEQRIYLLNAWRERRSSRNGSERRWPGPKLLTQLGHGVTDALYAEVREHFSEKELVDLTWGVVAINGWNRLSIGFGRRRRNLPDHEASPSPRRS